MILQIIINHFQKRYNIIGTNKSDHIIITNGPHWLRIKIDKTQLHITDILDEPDGYMDIKHECYDLNDPTVNIVKCIDILLQ